MVRTKTKKLRGGHYGRGMKSGRGKGKKGGNGMACKPVNSVMLFIMKYQPYFPMTPKTGHKPVITTAKKTIRDFNIRKGLSIGAKVTLRKADAYKFLKEA